MVASEERSDGAVEPFEIKALFCCLLSEDEAAVRCCDMKIRHSQKVGGIGI